MTIQLVKRTDGDAICLSLCAQRFPSPGLERLGGIPTGVFALPKRPTEQLARVYWVRMSNGIPSSPAGRRSPENARAGCSTTRR